MVDHDITHRNTHIEGWNASIRRRRKRTIARARGAFISRALRANARMAFFRRTRAKARLELERKTKENNFSCANAKTNASENAREDIREVTKGTSSLALGIREDDSMRGARRTTTMTMKRYEASPNDAREFVNALALDGTLTRLEKAAMALKKEASSGVEDAGASRARERSNDDGEQNDGETSTRVQKTIVFVDGVDGDGVDGDDESPVDGQGTRERDGAARRLRLDSRSNSEEDVAAREPGPTLTRSLAMRRRERALNCGTISSSTSSEGFTPPRGAEKRTPAPARSSLERERTRVSSHKSLEKVSTSSTSHGTPSPDDDVRRLSSMKLPKTPGMAKTLDASLADAVRASLGDESGVKTRHDDVFPAMLQRETRLAMKTCKAATLGLTLLSRVDDITHIIDGEKTRHSMFALELERSKVEALYRVSGLVNEIPSKRLRDGLDDLHKSVLENIARQYHARMLQAQRMFLNSIISDIRVLDEPKSVIEAFEFVCALSFDLDAHDARLRERAF